MTAPNRMEILSLIAIVVATSGCTYTPPVSSSKSTQNRSAGYDLKLPFSEGQIWRGYYNCRKGTTSLAFRIQEVSDSTVATPTGEAHEITAVFDFDHNNGEATGAYYLSGRYYPENAIAFFEPREWIRNPAGYRMVGMDGNVSPDGATYEGSITGTPLCEDFRVSL